MRPVWRDRIFLTILIIDFVNRGPGVCEYGTGLFKIEML